MRVRNISLRNYRCVRDATLELGNFTSMVGPNGVGKSTFLRALELFYDPSPKVVLDDFFAGDGANELTVTITYCALSDEAHELFEKYLVGDSLSVERVFSVSNGKVVSRFHGASLRHGPFRAVRVGLEIRDRGKTAKASYDALRLQDKYASLSQWTALGEVNGALSAWEAENAAECSRERDDGQFFGFGEVGHGYLERFTRLLYIPAVREAAADAAESRGSVLSSLMDLVVRSALTNKLAFRRLQERSQLLYARQMDPTKLSELGALGEELSSALKLYVPDAGVALNWRPLGTVELPMPTADIRLIEGEFHTSVERTGHGLQRAFIMTMLQQLTKVRTAPRVVGEGETPTSYPNLVLAIEEPELYQHPTRQRHLSKTLQRLATGGIAGLSQTTQVVCATHSPLFISVDRVDELRLLRRGPPVDGQPKATCVVSTTLDRLAEVVWTADGERGPKYSGATLLPRIKPIMTPWVNEGFFADVVVLVEGEDDRAALMGVAHSLGIDIDGFGFAVLPCGGKTCLDRPFAIFTELGIPTFMMWDGDKGDKEANPQDNHRLLRMVGSPVTDWPEALAHNFACFEVDLETTMRAEIGADVYDASLQSCQEEFSIPKRKHARKNPSVVARLVELAKTSGRVSTSLEKIVLAVAKLRE
jgi:putative ATP-dependent endonuclease of OLD family